MDGSRVRSHGARAGVRHAAAIATLALASFVATAGPADASLVLLQRDPDVAVTFFGPGGYSADGLGQFGSGGALQAEVPAGATVVQAYLYGTYFSGEIAPGDEVIDFDGSSVSLTPIGSNEPPEYLRTARADVTSPVATKVGSGGGITDFVIGNDPSSLDGVALVVVYNKPGLPNTTIGILDGEASSDGDAATFEFAAPIDKSIPGFRATMSLGSGFSFQGDYGPTHQCGGGQFSTVDVNASRLTSCAGHYDDGDAGNGALITVGGVGDSTDNPADPNGQTGEDDELYDLESFIEDGDTELTITNANPSQDDNLFLAVIAITGETDVPPENCSDGVDNDGDGLADAADPDCGSDPPPGCGEDGLQAAGDTGVLSGVVHDQVEPVLHDNLAQLEGPVHDLNCGQVVPLEDLVDGFLVSVP